MKPIDLTTRQINECKLQITHLQAEIIRLQNIKAEASKKEGMSQWLGFTFESSSGLTDEFSAFARDFKKYIKQTANDEDKKYELLGFSRGHFECSGFVKRGITQKFAYFSISDVRHFPDAWFNNILVRTAKNEKDYTGGSNNYCTLNELEKMFDYLTK